MSNLLISPLSEITQSIKSNSWGIDPSRTALIPESSFPITEEDIASVEASSTKEGRIDSRVNGKVRIGLLDGGEVEVVLDGRGWTIESYTTTTTKTYPNETFESLEALLIASSPKYVEAMTNEVAKRFAGSGASGANDDNDVNGDEAK